MVKIKHHQCKNLGIKHLRIKHQAIKHQQDKNHPDKTFVIATVQGLLSYGQVGEVADNRSQSV